MRFFFIFFFNYVSFSVFGVEQCLASASQYQNLNLMLEGFKLLYTLYKNKTMHNFGIVSNTNPNRRQISFTRTTFIDIAMGRGESWEKTWTNIFHKLTLKIIIIVIFIMLYNSSKRVTLCQHVFYPINIGIISENTLLKNLFLINLTADLLLAQQWISK